MSDPNVPSMSVVLATPDTYETIRRTTDLLRRQTVKEHLEIVVVAPSAGGLALDPAAADGFWGLQVVEHEATGTVGSANAAGVRAATAPVVALAEDHSFPAPDWAAALIAAHRGPWAAVGPAVDLANPDSAVSWADFLIGYGAWRAPATSGVVDHLPGHNSSYKRAVLLAYGDALDAMFEAESVLHWDLRANGHLLFLAADAVVAHMNFELLSSWIPMQLLAGRVFAATRAQGWSRPRRLIFVAGSPLIPLVRLARVARAVRRPPRPPRRALPVLLLGLALDGVGQCLGYALGPGTAPQALHRYEHRRDRFLRRPSGAGPPR